MRSLLQFSACFALGLVVAAMLLICLMFFGQFDWIDGLIITGKPLAHLSLTLLPDAFWSDLTGIADAAQNRSVQSFLQMCAALGQCALLLALGFFRLWYRS
nr:homoserine O-succinyltransferase [uncultured Pseudomonas sp.]